MGSDASKDVVSMLGWRVDAGVSVLFHAALMSMHAAAVYISVLHAAAVYTSLLAAVCLCRVCITLPLHPLSD